MPACVRVCTAATAERGLLAVSIGRGNCYAPGMKRSSPVAAAVHLAFVCVAMACSGCGGETASSAQNTDAGASKGTEAGADAGACVVPAAATTTDCKAQRTYMICQGSTAPYGAPPKCRNACATSDYALSCTHGAAPADSLGCHAIPMPTPQGVLNYCCPCGK